MYTQGILVTPMMLKQSSGRVPSLEGANFRYTGSYVHTVDSGYSCDVAAKFREASELGGGELSIHGVMCTYRGFWLLL